MLPKNKLWTKNFQCMTFASAFLQQRKTNLTGRRSEARLKMTSFQDFSGWHILLSLSGWPTGFAQKWIFLTKGITSWDEGETRPDLNRFRVFGNYFLVPNYAYSNLLLLFQRLTRQGVRGEPWIFLFSFILSLNCSALGHSAKVPPCLLKFFYWPM